MRMVDVLLTGKDEWRYGEERANCRVETEAVAMRVMLWEIGWNHMNLRFDDGSFTISSSQ